MARPEPRGWRQAALGGILVALGALLGLKRLGIAKRPAPKRPEPRLPHGGKRGKAKVEARQPQKWPPPSKKRKQSSKASPKQQGGAAPDHRAVSRDSQELGYEVRDTKASTIGWVMAIGALIVAASIAGLFLMIGQFRSTDSRHAPLTPQQQAAITPPGPKFQDHPFRDIASERKREADLLNRYGWADAAHTRARIPIDRAVALVIGKPLDPPP